MFNKEIQDFITKNAIDLNSKFVIINDLVFEIDDKINKKPKVTFVFWEGSKRFSIFIEEFEVFDDYFNNLSDLINQIQCILKSEISIDNIYCNERLIKRILYYSFCFEGKSIKDKIVKPYNFSIKYIFGFGIYHEVIRYQNWFN
jgi:hypothetical protein